MGLVARRRDLTRRAIERNPTQITLKRYGEKGDGAGGFEEGEFPLSPQIFRVFISSNRGSRDISQEGGQMQINQVGLLAEHDADLQKGDKFELDGRKYTVAKVDPVRLKSEVVSIQCDLEEVV